MNHKPEQKPDTSVLCSDLDVVPWKHFYCLYLHFDWIFSNVLYSLNLQRVPVVCYFCTEFPIYCSCVVRFIMLYYLDSSKGNIFDSVTPACNICELYTAFEFTWVIRPKTITRTLSFMLPLVPVFFIFFSSDKLTALKGNCIFKNFPCFLSVDITSLLVRSHDMIICYAGLTCSLFDFTKLTTIAWLPDGPPAEVQGITCWAHWEFGIHIITMCSDRQWRGF